MWWIRTVLSWTALLAASAVLVIAVLIPKIAGAQPYTILTPSMSPTYPPGTLVVVKPTDLIGPGTVVTYQVQSGLPEVVTHRVMSTAFDDRGERRFVTQGDANDSPDRALVRPEQIRGSVWYSVPYLGYVNNWLTGSTRTAVVGIAAGLLFGYAAWQFVSAARDRSRRSSS
ncbi:signal peptidase I [Rhodococcus sp. BP-349]|jgi:signal peptidase|nr:signal peptidase I [Rhodococcus sp. BP-363]MBY6543751.1 signal peptidase I [Rhodococcus sp. BP-369]MBY6562981.1 signal peptidase I [Rhodococcus sp. BP-370]MBY6577273.1 signal peptidase I [Rhodococcus sp. BP-364]MBY6586574.1 signal peptidase I [Rhodococcus sp. BP-358]MBY6590911.1 signal peptidase I [Rhodococcus sp. BP-362]MBY6595755.1 signal peptidase I [Rhodococcus sp. BP-359]MBY6600094.1 signal peptidase I [Rhodococcus sp. BP-353]MBY6604431.1 signal peptidase I [Rhodococcus sp. BP-351]